MAVSSPFNVYEHSGLRFAYPENWRLEDETGDEARLQLTVESPDTAFWTLAVYDGEIEPDSLAQQAVEAMRAEYPDLEASTAEETIAGIDLVGHDVNFICLDLTNTAQVRAFRLEGQTLLVLAQAEDRELKTASLIFTAMIQSLVSGPPETVP